MSGLKQLNVRLPEDMHRALARHKELTGEDKSEVIRRGIELVLHGNATMPANGAVTDEPLEPGDVDASDTLEKVRALLAQRS